MFAVLADTGCSSLCWGRAGAVNGRQMLSGSRGKWLAGTDFDQVDYTHQRSACQFAVRRLCNLLELGIKYRDNVAAKRAVLIGFRTGSTLHADSQGRLQLTPGPRQAGQA